VEHQSPNARLVKVYEAPTIAETLVLRGVLNSAGIYAPDFDAVDPFPLHDPPLFAKSLGISRCNPPFMSTSYV